MTHGAQSERAIDRLARLLEHAGVVVTFDPRRDITLCMCCGARCGIWTRTPSKYRVFERHAIGFASAECRRVCSDACYADSLLRFIARPYTMTRP